MIKVNDIYEDEYGNSYEVLKVTSKSIYVSPFSGKLKFDRESFEELFYSDSDNQDEE